MSKKLKVFLAMIALVGTLLLSEIVAPRSQVETQDSCHRMMSAALAQNVDGARYNVDELCKTAREIASGRY